MNRAERVEIEVVRKKTPVKLVYEVRSVSEEERPGLSSAGRLVDPFAVAAQKYPPEDLDVYRRALHVRDIAVQRVVINAVANYPEGFDLLSALIEEDVQSAVAVFAANMLASYELTPSRTLVLKSLFEKAGASSGGFLDGHPLKYVLSERLAQADPAVYAPVFLDEINAYLDTYWNTYTVFDNRIFNDITAVALLVPKERLYPLVPKLLRMAEETRFDISMRSPALLSTLELLTGQRFSAKSGNLFNPSIRSEIIAKYREYYYTNMYPETARPR